MAPRGFRSFRVTSIQASSSVRASASKGCRSATRSLVIGAGPIGNLCAQLASHFGHRVTVVDLVEDRLTLLAPACESTFTDVPPLSKFQFIIEATGGVGMAARITSEASTGSNLLFLGL